MLSQSERRPLNNKVSEVVLACLCILVVSSTKISAQGVKESSPLRVGFHFDRNHLDEAYSRKDIKVATEILFTELVYQKGKLHPTFQSFEDLTSYINAIVEERLDYIELKPLVWLGLPNATETKNHATVCHSIW